MGKMPRWADVVLVPLICLLIAFGFCGLLIWGIGQDPIEALRIMITGSLGSTYGFGYTLYYATNFMFTGLAVSIAFQASLFNIGGEGQATLGGLGVALSCLLIPWPHWTLALAGSIVAAMAFGAAWALIPAWLQAKRGSHIVITTMMFNFIAYALMNYLLVNVLRPIGSMDPASARFDKAFNLPKLGDILGLVGIPFSSKNPANISLLVALACAFLVWVLLWHTRLGYAMRAFGKSEKAAVYAGISPVRITMYALMLSGGLSGMMAVNAVQGEAHRLLLNSVEGAGFIGIAVALMGRNHPFGIVIASILFGFLYEGGSQLALGTSIPREVITVLQALVILFTGALPYMVQRPLERLFQMRARRAA
ncbi:MAG: ABC transporter permease [Paracoccaceae bacterium]